jgi:hypothetical protein
MELETAEAGMNSFHQGESHRNICSQQLTAKFRRARQQEDPDLSSEANHKSTTLWWRESGLLSDFSFGVSTFSRKSDMKEVYPRFHED